MEKKLTNEEIVKAFEDEKEFLLKEEKRTGNAPDTQLVYIRGEAVLKILDLIHRLQEDYSKLKERYVKVLDLNEKVIAEQKAEIERLKTFIDFKTANVVCEKCKQQAVKDTAKEICEMIDRTCISSKGYLCRIILKRYVVEVE